jgi:hypothetical protein
LQVQIISKNYRNDPVRVQSYSFHLASPFIFPITYKYYGYHITLFDDFIIIFYDDSLNVLSGDSWIYLDSSESGCLITQKVTHVCLVLKI